MENDDFKIDTRRAIDRLEKRADGHDADIHDLHVKIDTKVEPINTRQNYLIGAFSVLGIGLGAFGRAFLGLITGGDHGH